MFKLEMMKMLPHQLLHKLWLNKTRLLLLEKNSNKCKLKWMLLLPKQIKRELNNKLNMKQILAKETQLLNFKVS